MDRKNKRLIFAAVAIVATFAVIFAISSFFSNLETEISDEKMVQDYLEVDKALKTKEQCDKEKNGEACLKTGFYYLDGKHVDVNQKKAFKYFTKACNFNDLEACRIINKKKSEK